MNFLIEEGFQYSNRNRCKARVFGGQGQVGHEKVVISKKEMGAALHRFHWVQMSLSTFTTPGGSFLHLTASEQCYNLNRFLVTFNPLCATFLHVRSYLLLHSRRNWFVSVRQQPNPTTHAIVTEHWIRLILTFARHRKLFVLCVEDTEVAGSDWEEILHNGRINRTSSITKKLSNIDKEVIGKMPPPYLSDILATMVDKSVAAYEPAKQTRAVLVYWRLPEEWAEVLYDWVCEIVHFKKY